MFISTLCKYFSMSITHDKRMNDKNNKELKLVNKSLNILLKNKNINANKENELTLNKRFLNNISWRNKSNEIKIIQVKNKIMYKIFLIPNIFLDKHSLYRKLLRTQMLQ